MYNAKHYNVFNSDMRLFLNDNFFQPTNKMKEFLQYLEDRHSYNNF